MGLFSTLQSGPKTFSGGEKLLSGLFCFLVRKGGALCRCSREVLLFSFSGGSFWATLDFFTGGPPVRVFSVLERPNFWKLGFKVGSWASEVGLRKWSEPNFREVEVGSWASELGSRASEVEP